MKKILMTLMVSMLAISLTFCGKKADTQAKTDEKTVATDKPVAKAEEKGKEIADKPLSESAQRWLGYIEEATIAFKEKDDQKLREVADKYHVTIKELGNLDNIGDPKESETVKKRLEEINKKYGVNIYDNWGPIFAKPLTGIKNISSTDMIDFWERLINCYKENNVEETKKWIKVYGLKEEDFVDFSISELLTRYPKGKDFIFIGYV